MVLKVHSLKWLSILRTWSKILTQCGALHESNPSYVNTYVKYFWDSYVHKASNSVVRMDNLSEYQGLMFNFTLTEQRLLLYLWSE